MGEGCAARNSSASLHVQLSILLLTCGGGGGEAILISPLWRKQYFACDWPGLASRLIFSSVLSESVGTSLDEAVQTGCNTPTAICIPLTCIHVYEVIDSVRQIVRMLW
jgi:hypothetical protein